MAYEEIAKKAKKKAKTATFTYDDKGRRTKIGKTSRRERQATFEEWGIRRAGPRVKAEGFRTAKGIRSAPAQTSSKKATRRKKTQGGRDPYGWMQA